jgi:hypothetical protein
LLRVGRRSSETLTTLMGLIDPPRVYQYNLRVQSNQAKTLKSQIKL